MFIKTKQLKFSVDPPTEVRQAAAQAAGPKWQVQSESLIERKLIGQTHGGAASVIQRHADLKAARPVGLFAHHGRHRQFWPKERALWVHASLIRTVTGSSTSGATGSLALTSLLQGIVLGVALLAERAFRCIVHRVVYVDFVVCARRFVRL